MNRTRLGWKSLVVGGLALSGLSACNAPLRPMVEGTAYPMEAPRLGSVDVQVLRDGERISLTNTSGAVIGPGTMWLNGRYGREIKAIAQGQTATYRLSSFVDEYADAFRGGGFWAIEDPDTVVRVEVEQDGSLLGLIVTRGQPVE